MYLQRVLKCTLSPFHDKIFYESNIKKTNHGIEIDCIINQNNFNKFYKNSTDQLSNLLLLASPIEHS